MTQHATQKQMLIQRIKILEMQVVTTRKIADKAVNQYQIQRKAFNDWLACVNEKYLTQRTEKMNQTEAIRQEMAKIRLNYTLNLHKLRQAWAKTFLF